MYNESWGLVTSFQAHADYIQRIKQSPFNNDLVATASFDNTTKIWNITSNWCLFRTYTGHIRFVYSLEWINEDTIATGGYDQTIQIWSVSTGIKSLTISTSASWICALQLLSNRLHLAAACGNYKINIYNINNGGLIATLSGHTDRVNDLVLVNANLLASTSYDKTVRLWDLTTNSLKYNFTEHTSYVMGIKLVSSDILASGSYDNTIKLWNLTSGSLQRTIVNHSSVVMYALDMLNSQTLVSGFWDNYVILWNWQTGDLLKTINTNVYIQSLAVLNFTSITSTFKIGDILEWKFIYCLKK